VTQPGGTGITCLVVDADPGTPGEQDARTLPFTGSFTVDVVARDVPAVNGGLGFFNVTLLYDPTWLTAGTPTSTLPVSDSFSCPTATGQLPETDPFADGNTATGDAFITCLAPGLIGPTGSFVIASFPFTITGGGLALLEPFKSRISDAQSNQLASCNPVDVQAGAGCLNAAVTNLLGLPTATPTVTPIATATATTAAVLATDTPTPLPTDTPAPLPTDTPTDTPTPLPTDTPAPLPTDTPIPPPTDTPTDTPPPLPTDTPAPLPTDTPAPLPTDTPLVPPILFTRGEPPAGGGTAPGRPSRLPAPPVVPLVVAVAALGLVLAAVQFVLRKPILRRAVSGPRARPGREMMAPIRTNVRIAAGALLAHASLPARLLLPVVLALVAAGALLPRLASGPQAEARGPAAAPPPGASIFIDPAGSTLMIGGPSETLNEVVAGVPFDPGLGSFQLNLVFDPTTIQLVIDEGPFLASTGRSTSCGFTALTEDNVLYNCASDGSQRGAYGEGVLATFRASPAPGLNFKPTLLNGRVAAIDNVRGNTRLFDTEDTLVPVGQLLDAVVLVRALDADLNQDCRVDITDEQFISIHYGTVLGSLLYIGFFDLEPAPRGDFDIDIKDLQFVFGRDHDNCLTPQPTPHTTETPFIPTVPAVTRTPTPTFTPRPTLTPPATATRTAQVPGPSATRTRTPTGGGHTATPGPGTPTTLETPTAVATATAGPCIAKGPNYWKGAPGAWPVAQVTLGSQAYTKAEALALLAQSITGDASVALAHQLIAAKLNAAIGVAIPAGPLNMADSLLNQQSGRLPYGTDPATPVGQLMVTVAAQLSEVNLQCGPDTPTDIVLGNDRPKGLPGTGGGSPFSARDLGWLFTFLSLGVGAVAIVALRNTVLRRGDDDEEP
jgi:hypothetical protein